MAHPYQRAIFDLREFSKIQSHIVPNEIFRIHKITTDSEFKDAFQHCFECFVDLLSLLKNNYFGNFSQNKNCSLVRIGH